MRDTPRGTLAEHLAATGQPFHGRPEFFDLCCRDSACVSAHPAVLHAADGHEEDGVAIFTTRTTGPEVVLTIGGAEHLAEALDAVLELLYKQRNTPNGKETSDEQD
ncbi:hypothetical protein [Sinomonas albida]|uniref:hypothetical protein n=1 Tax=Sinomonas albida TaxID=369942 RepID=UPI003018654D